LEKLTFPVVDKKDTASFTENITKQLTSDMPAETRDEAIARESGEAAEVRPDHQRPEAVGILPLWIMTLRAYTVSLKNLENIPKADKELHLRNILQGWSTLMLYSCIVFKEIVSKRELEIGDIKFNLDLPPTLDARVLRMILLSIPVYISDWVRRDLGSQKLALQLRNDDIPQTLSDAFLQTALYADLKLDEYLNRLKVLKDKASDANSQSFLEFILIKMRTIFLRLGLQQHEQEGFLRIAAELSAEIKGLTGEERFREIERYTTDLRRRDQVNKLRENMS
jgi:hypothetical protein